MSPIFRLLCLATLLASVTACSARDDGSSATPDSSADAPAPVVTPESPSEPSPDDPPAEPPVVDPEPADEPSPDPEPETDPPSPPVTDPGTYNRTHTERLSVAVNGPGRVDASRDSDTPSTPDGLVALLVSDNWAEINWVPSVDDTGIRGYRIYRDGNLVRTLDDIPDATNPVYETRDLRTTSYIDCNYTKNSGCKDVGQPGQAESHHYQVSAIDEHGNESPLSDTLIVEFPSAPSGAVVPDLMAADYVETFFDDFDSNRLLRSNWVTNLSFPQFDSTGRAVNGAQQYFVDTRGVDNGFAFDPFVVDNGTLKITAIETPDELSERAFGQPYLSGAISTRSKMDGITYGFVEMRAKVPSGNGLLSTFFLFQPSGNQYEIDILEHLGRRPNSATQNYHYRDGFRYRDTGYSGVPHASPTMYFDAGVDLSADFHTYAVHWTPERVIYYLDGTEVRRIVGPRVSDVPMDIVAQLVVGTPSFAGDPSGTPFPAVYEIDYVRVLQQP